MTRITSFLAAGPLLLAYLSMASGASAGSCTVSPSGVNFGSFSPLTLASVDKTLIDDA